MLPNCIGLDLGRGWREALGASGFMTMRSRAALLGLLAVAVACLGVVTLGPRLDPRWQVVGADREATLSERLTRVDRAPLLFVPGSVGRDPTSVATLVVVLPGLGETGRPFAEELVPAAEANRWLLLAPSPDYDPTSANELLASADLRVDDSLIDMVDQVRSSGFTVSPKIDLIGFSRGAQSAHRFVLRHPELVDALATFSAGTYTMPTSTAPYPLGVGGFDLWNHLHPFDPVALRQVRVLVGVGEADANPQDVVREWDAVGGPTRLDRGIRFSQALQQLGVPYRFQSYGGVGHRFVPAMRADAIAWFLGG